jgi:hypothetical protein
MIKKTSKSLPSSLTPIWRIDHVLSSSRFHEIFLLKSLHTSETLILKKIPDSIFDPEKLLQQQKISSPYLLLPSACYHEYKCHFITYPPQTTLQDFLQKNPMNLSAALNLGLSLSYAFEALQNAGFFEADLSLTNIYYQENIGFLLGDLSVIHAKTCGTEGFLAPEPNTVTADSASFFSSSEYRVTKLIAFLCLNGHFWDQTASTIKLLATLPPSLISFFSQGCADIPTERFPNWERWRFACQSLLQEPSILESRYILDIHTPYFQSLFHLRTQIINTTTDKPCFRKTLQNKKTDFLSEKKETALEKKKKLPAKYFFLLWGILIFAGSTSLYFLYQYEHPSLDDSSQASVVSKKTDILVHSHQDSSKNNNAHENKSSPDSSANVTNASSDASIFCSYDLTDSMLTSLENLSTLSRTSIITLYLGQNPLSSLQYIDSLSQLQTVFANDCVLKKKEAITSISHLKHLNTLSLAGNQITDLSALSSLPVLKTLDISKNKSCHDVASLLPLSSLRNLILTQTAFSHKEVKQLKKALPQCKIYSDWDTP